jgi:hypothetical protein
VTPAQRARWAFLGADGLRAGGSAGPEGSVLVFPVLLATVAPIHALFRRRVTSAASDRR